MSGREIRTRHAYIVRTAPLTLMCSTSVRRACIAREDSL